MSTNLGGGGKRNVLVISEQRIYTIYSPNKANTCSCLKVGTTPGHQGGHLIVKRFVTVKTVKVRPGGRGGTQQHGQGQKATKGKRHECNPEPPIWDLELRGGGGFCSWGLGARVNRMFLHAGACRLKFQLLRGGNERISRGEEPEHVSAGSVFKALTQAMLPTALRDGQSCLHFPK